MIYYCCAPGCPGLPYAASVIRHPCGVVEELPDNAFSGPDQPCGHVEELRDHPTADLPECAECGAEEGQWCMGPGEVEVKGRVHQSRLDGRALRQWGRP